MAPAIEDELEMVLPNTSEHILGVPSYATKSMRVSETVLHEATEVVLVRHFVLGQEILVVHNKALEYQSSEMLHSHLICRQPHIPHGRLPLHTKLRAPLEAVQGLLQIERAALDVDCIS